MGSLIHQPSLPLSPSPHQTLLAEQPWCSSLLSLQHPTNRCIVRKPVLYSWDLRAHMSDGTHSAQSSIAVAVIGGSDLPLNNYGICRLYLPQSSASLASACVPFTPAELSSVCQVRTGTSLFDTKSPCLLFPLFGTPFPQLFSPCSSLYYNFADHSTKFPAPILSITAPFGGLVTLETWIVILSLAHM